MKDLILATIAVLMLLSGCIGGSGLDHGDSAEVEITDSSPQVGELVADAEMMFPEAGLPVDERFVSEELELKASGPTVIEAVGTGGFDPVVAVITEDGSVLAACDDWSGSTASRVVLEDVPSASRVIVWGMDGETGTVTVSAAEATQSDLEEWRGAATLDLGVMQATLSDDKDSEMMEDYIYDLNSSEIYAERFGNALLVPFSVPEDDWYSISLQSEDFDAYLVLLSFGRRGARVTEINDDTGGFTDSRILRELEEGTYGAMVMSYFGQGGEFTLSLDRLEFEEGSAVPVPVPGTATGFLSGNQIALSHWATIDEDWHYSSINGATPVVAFSFTIEEEGDYHISASADFDATMTLVSFTEIDGLIFLDYSDDWEGTDPGLTMTLVPGELLALVADYNGTAVGEVTFSVELLENFDPEPVFLEPDVSYDLEISPRQSFGLFDLEIVGGYVYGVSAESEYLDPIIHLTFADSSQLVDDDGGEDFDSYLEFVPDADQLGYAVLRVNNYDEGREGIITVTVERLERLSDQEVFSLYD